MPNALAYLVFWSWPLVVAALFMRQRIALALTVAIVGGYLFLPHKIGYKLPTLPLLDKDLLPTLVALLMCVLVQGRFDPDGRPWADAGWLPRSWAGKLLLALFVFVPIPTVLTNPDALVFGDRELPGLRLYDAGSFVNGQIVQVLPFLLARRYLGSEAAQETVLKVLLAMGLAYSVLVLLEARLSPFINETLYGFRQFNWRQQIRGDGFRPVVFLKHGLWTAVVTLMAAVAAAAIWRAWAGRPRRGLLLAAAVWMCFVLVASNSLGALLIGLILVPAAMFLPTAQRLLLALAIAGTVLLYPMIRTAGYVPTTQIVTTLRELGPQFRAASLEYRFENEDILLERANRRPLFGWGGWGRSRVYDERGEDVSTTDGRWIITFGAFGWAGYIGEYGLLTLPIFLLWQRRRRVGALGISLGLVLVLCANLVDIVPNATLTPLTWLVAGAVLGRVELAAGAPSRVPGRGAGPPRVSSPLRPSVPAARTGAPPPLPPPPVRSSGAAGGAALGRRP